MKIDIDTPMVAAHREGIDTYTPVFDGSELEVECGNPAITLRNLEKIIGPKRQPVSFHGAHGQVLIIFDSGESYLATGFGYGSTVDEVMRFAEFAAKHGFGEVSLLRRQLIGLDVNWSGPVPILQEEIVTDEF